MSAIEAKRGQVWQHTSPSGAKFITVMAYDQLLYGPDWSCIGTALLEGRCWKFGQLRWPA